MNMEPATGLKRTPLYDLHRDMGAKIVVFAGWEMPVEYTSILDEHRAVRERAGLFDVSHMGELEVSGPGALDLVQRVITNDAARLEDGRALYTPMCREDGGCLDDMLVLRLAADRYLLVVNAANTESDAAWIAKAAEGMAGVEVDDRSAECALLALQGPRAPDILQPVSDLPLASIPRFGYQGGIRVAGVPCLVSRTGYTGEDGFEIFCHPDMAPRLWTVLLEAGRPHGLVPAGLGARDTLRLEAALPLYGHELREDINPLEARLGTFVKLDKGDFIGREALSRAKAEGVRRRLIGLEMVERGVPRHGYPVVAGDQVVGEVTSGGYAPTLERNIALALVAADHAGPDAELKVRIRGRDLAARVVPLPFYRRERRAAGQSPTGTPVAGG